MNKILKFSLITASVLVVFIIFTVMVKTVDVAAIGPLESTVGFSSINKWYIDLVGTHEVLYDITDWASILTIPVGSIFFVIGLVELIKRKNIFKVDINILALGIFYVFTFVMYLVFQFLVINYRPILINGQLESSYPSSTTILSLIIFLTAIDQINIYIKNKTTRTILISVGIAFMLFLLVGRLLSGVHWLTDIFGALLGSVLLFSIYFLSKVILKQAIK